MFLKCVNLYTDEFTYSPKLDEYYVVLGVRFIGDRIEVLSYESGKGVWFNARCFDISSDYKIPSDWHFRNLKSGMSPDVSAMYGVDVGNFYIAGYQDLLEPLHYVGLLEMNYSDLQVFYREYIHRVLSNPSIKAVSKKWTAVQRIDFPDLRDELDAKARQVISQMENETNIIFTQKYCPWSLGVKMLLDNNSMEYFEIDITNNPMLTNYLADTLGQLVTPVCLVNNKVVVGYDEEAILN